MVHDQVEGVQLPLVVLSRAEEGLIARRYPV